MVQWQVEIVLRAREVTWRVIVAPQTQTHLLRERFVKTLRVESVWSFNVGYAWRFDNMFGCGDGCQPWGGSWSCCGQTWHALGYGTLEHYTQACGSLVSCFCYPLLQTQLLQVLSEAVLLTGDRRGVRGRVWVRGPSASMVFSRVHFLIHGSHEVCRIIDSG